MVIFSVWLVERLGRRKGLIYGAFIGSSPMYVFPHRVIRCDGIDADRIHRWYIGGYVMRADPAKVAAAGQYTRNGWGYLAMVCVYLYGFVGFPQGGNPKYEFMLTIMCIDLLPILARNYLGLLVTPPPLSKNP